MSDNVVPVHASPRMGGQARIVVIARGGDELRDSLLGTDAGGSVLPEGIAGVLRQRAVGTEVEVVWEPATVAELAGGRALDPDADVVILAPGDIADQPVEAGTAAIRDLTAAIRSGSGAHVLVYNGSVHDAEDLVTTYHGIPEPLSQRINRRNLALMWLSAELGISIVDVDRIAAERGAAVHAPRPYQYSPTALADVRDEVVRILDDYGFFEARPLVAQVGAEGN